jgi:23S rRNA (cytidine1920-2'-O)/16S rRNA (cytidine1409-2'-O)-methyltransferase
MSKIRLDVVLMEKGLVTSRRQAVGVIMAGDVIVDGKKVDKPGTFIKTDAQILLANQIKYVSRGALKLSSVAGKFSLSFKDKIVLDVGSSTGGFTDYALQNGAIKVFAIDVGTNQLEHKLRVDSRVEVHEKTDIRNTILCTNKADLANNQSNGLVCINNLPDIVLIDVSFISLRLVLPAVLRLVNNNTQIVALVKPQFEVGAREASKHKGVIKNDTIRRLVLKEFEAWSKGNLKILNKADSAIKGQKGNIERFYLLKKL